MTKKITRMLALDTSSSSTGWAYFENGVYKVSGIIDLKKETDKDVRFQTMLETILVLLTEYKPGIVVAETVAVIRNMQAVRKLCEICGAVRGWCIEYHIFYAEIRPTEWRSQVGIQAKGLKRDDFKRLSKEYAIKKIVNKKDINDDEADACCIGVAYIKMFS
jgi:Holliday junction resolvasome RuvABC endonuclease subunit